MLATARARAARRTSCTSSGSPCSRSTRACCRAARAARAHRPRRPAARAAPAASARRSGALYERVDAVVVHSEHGRARLVDELGVDPAQGARDPARRLRAPAPSSEPDAAAARARRASTGRSCCSSACCARTRASTCCSRPGAGSTGAELWVVGMPRMDIGRAARRGAARRALRRALRRRRASSPALFRARRPRRAALPRDRPVGRAVHRARVRHAAAAERRRRLPARSRRRRRRARRARATRRRCARRSRALLDDAARASASRRRRAARARRALRLGRDRRRAPRALRAPWREPRVSAAKARSSGSAPALLVYTQVGYPLLLAGARARAATAAPAAGAAAAPEPHGLADRRRPRRGRVIAAKVANALALDWPRERLESSSPCDGSPDDTAARARAAGADLVLELPARRQDPRAGRRVRGAARRRCSRSPTPTRCGSPARCARSSRPFADPRGRLRLRPGRVRQRGRHQPGGPLLALRDVAARAASRALASVTGRQRRDLRRAPRGLRRGRPGHGPRPLVPVQHRQARLARGLRAGGAGDREDGPDDRGRVRAQAADDEPRLADRRCAAGCSTRAATRRSTR